MAVILDANLLIVLVNNDPRGEKVFTQLSDWIEQATPLHMPYLALYEIANALTRSIVAEAFTQEDLKTAWDSILSLPITYHPFSQGARVTEIALSLKRQNAYDAAYLALTEILNAELWTLDSPLYRNAIGQGFAIRLLGT